jgi:hypothetical protein
MPLPVPVIRSETDHPQTDGAGTRVLQFVGHTVVAVLVVGVCSLKVSALAYHPSIGIGSSLWLGQFQSKYLLVFEASLGAAFGWGNSLIFQHKTARWVWTFPTIYLVFRLLFWHDPAASALVPEHHWIAAVSHFFGNACSFAASIQELRYRGGQICLDQLLVTAPFYSSIAYSLSTVAQQQQWFLFLKRSL